MDDPPVHHSLRRESISAIGVQSVRSTWFEDSAVPLVPKETTLQPNQGPQWQVIKEEVLPMKDQPKFPALAVLAERGLLVPDTWKWKHEQVSLKATIDIPMQAQSLSKMVWTP